MNSAVKDPFSEHEDDQTKAATHKMLDEADEYILFSITKEEHRRLGYFSSLGKMTMIGMLEYELFRMKVDITQGLQGVNDEGVES